MKRILLTICMVFLLQGCIATAFSIFNWTMMSAALVGEVIEAGSNPDEKNTEKK